MKILITLLVFSFYTLSINAQKKCVNDEDGNCIAKGESKEVKVKSSYGTAYKSSLRIGNWEFFGLEGNKVAEGKYTLKNDASYLDGEWKYYNEDGTHFMTRVYSLGAVISTVYLDTGCYVYLGDRICANSDTLGNLFVEESKGQLKFQYKTALKINLNGEPSKLVAASKTGKAPVLTEFDSDSMFSERYPLSKTLLNTQVHSAITADNLINNGNFEMASDRIPDDFNAQIAMSKDQNAIFWGSSNETPDIYKKKGNCYAGFRVMGVNFEVLRNKLKVPLEADKSYCLQFKLKLKEDNSFAFNGISVVLSKEEKFFKNSEEGQKMGVVLQSHPSLVLGYRQQWMVFSGTIEAEGGENYIYFSNFTDAKSLKVFKADTLAPDYINEIYYYIDDVVLRALGENENCPCNVKGCELDTIEKVKVAEENDFFKNPKAGQSIILRNIQFETAKWNLLPESYETLDSLVDLMIRFPNMVIEVVGHTDNKGKSTENVKLSKNRASAVVEYLINSGIEAERMVADGKGQELPIDTNDNETGRANNRRVEFKIISL